MVNQSQISRYPSLDGLRALSIIMVLVSHLTITAGTWIHPHPFIFVFLNGDFGVNIFFVISGFLITTLILSEEKQHGQFSLGTFYIKRIFRIFPTYYFFLFIVFFCNHYSLISDILVGSFIPPLTFTTGTLPIDTGWTLAHTWSLSIEEQFYLLWPLILYSVKSSKTRNILLLGCFFSAMIFRALYYRLFHHVDYLFFLRYDCIASGCLLALNQDIVKKLFSSRTFVVLAGTGSVISVTVLNYLSYKATLGMLTVPLTFTSHALFGAFCICNFTSSKASSTVGFKILNNTVLTYIGRLSFSLYIWQQFFLQPATETTSGWKTFPLNILLAIFAAVISFHGVEKPFLKWRARFMGSKPLTLNV
jgi:peptidoglycan/LPS O-acetylase OafA/YrhL